MNIDFDIAKRWRTENEYLGKGGVVIIFNDVATGWVAELPPASQWTPGGIAVDEEGRTWRASGGNENDGALRWEAFGSSRWMPRK